MPKDWEWHFIDGDEDAYPAPGVASIFPGPYLSHYTEPSLRNVQDVFDTIDDIVDEEGPFDAIMGFSQVSRWTIGGSLFLLQERLTSIREVQ